MHPAFAADVPYVVAVVETDEGVRIVTNLLGVDPGDVGLGVPVAVEFETRPDGVVYPQFRVTAP
jgi:uncharacterized OB-fold protein